MINMLRPKFNPPPRAVFEIKSVLDPEAIIIE